MTARGGIAPSAEALAKAREAVVTHCQANPERTGFIPFACDDEGHVCELHAAIARLIDKTWDEGYLAGWDAAYLNEAEHITDLRERRDARIRAEKRAEELRRAAESFAVGVHQYSSNYAHPHLSFRRPFTDCRVEECARLRDAITAQGRGEKK